MGQLVEQEDQHAERRRPVAPVDRAVAGRSTQPGRDGLGPPGQGGDRVDGPPDVADQTADQLRTDPNHHVERDRDDVAVLCVDPEERGVETNQIEDEGQRGTDDVEHPHHPVIGQLAADRGIT